MSPILNLQQRQRELGRIRLGQKVGAKGRPEKLDRFRFTSPSRSLIESVAAKYGGEVRPWNGAGTEQWEVITEARRLPILVPPQPVNQWMELWSGGGCQRRCDGEREVLSDQPCLCDPDPEKRECKPTTRLNVVLRDVHGVGVWRLESHGYYAATELPQTAAFLASATVAGTYLPAHLGLEERVVKRQGKTSRFIVPLIEVDVTPAQLMAGQGAALQIGDGSQPAVGPAQRPAIEAPGDGRDWVALVESASTAEELRALWDQAKDAGAPQEVAQAITAKVTRLAARTGAGQEQKPVPSQDGDPDVLWQMIVQRCPVGWTLDDLTARFTESTGVTPEAADSAAMQRFLDEITGAVTA